MQSRTCCSSDVCRVTRRATAARCGYGDEAARCPVACEFPDFLGLNGWLTISGAPANKTLRVSAGYARCKFGFRLSIANRQFRSMQAIEMVLEPNPRGVEPCRSPPQEEAMKASHAETQRHGA